MQGRIEFADVGFRYQADGPEVLSGISFSVEPGQVIGIVGPSGSGKSTLVKLLQRLYLPTAGRIAIDGFNLADMDRHWVRRHMGVVQQDTVLFHGTVRENIALADPALPLDAVIAVARIAGIHDAVQRLPQGYDTPVGERGVTLSGGERQRIAIARALANDPRILILDEATSALDYETEAAIQRNMRQICAGRTVIVVAHRLSTVRFADRILLLAAVVMVMLALKIPAIAAALISGGPQLNSGSALMGAAGVAAGAAGAVLAGRAVAGAIGGGLAGAGQAISAARSASSVSSSGAGGGGSGSSPGGGPSGGPGPSSDGGGSTPPPSPTATASTLVRARARNGGLNGVQFGFRSGTGLDRLFERRLPSQRDRPATLLAADPVQTFDRHRRPQRHPRGLRKNRQHSPP